MTNIYNSFQEWTQLLTERHFLFILWFSSVSLPLCTKCWLVGSPHLWALRWRDSLPASGTHSGMPGSQDCTTDQYNHWSTSRSCYSLYHNRHLREGKYFTHQFGRKPDWSIFIGDVNPKWFALEVYKISPQTCNPTHCRAADCKFKPRWIIWDLRGCNIPYQALAPEPPFRASCPQHRWDLPCWWTARPRCWTPGWRQELHRNTAPINSWEVYCISASQGLPVCHKWLWLTF